VLQTFFADQDRGENLGSPKAMSTSNAFPKVWKKRFMTGLKTKCYVFGIAGALMCGALSRPAAAEAPTVFEQLPSVAIVPLFPDNAPLEAEPILMDAESMVTNWGYGPAENAYNQLILDCIEKHWPDKENPLDPILFKSLIAAESAFKKDVFSRTGCAGLVQIAPDTATRFGLSMYPVDERLIPEKAIPVGLKVLAEKQRVVLEPDNYFGILLSKPDKKCPFGLVVYQDFQQRGLPQGDDLIMLSLASYNGGGGTVMRAMARAVEMGKNPHSWDDLVGSGPGDSPLYAACEMIYKGGAAGKYREMANYPRKILSLAQKTRS
jgi:soluble lytic murein transglycosylase-like protein